MSRYSAWMGWRLLAAALAVLLSGCAGAGRDYSDCCIPYLYCPPPPLPWVSYEGCHCPTPVASRYGEPQSGYSAPSGDVPSETPAPRPPTDANTTLSMIDRRAR